MSGFFVALVALVLLVLFSCCGKYIFLSFSVFFWVVSQLLTLGNWWHFQYFQSYFNYQSLELSSESPESLFSISAFAYKTPALILIAGSSFFLYLSIRYYKRSYFGSGAVLPVLLGLCGAAFASGAIVYNSVTNYRALNMLSLSPAYFNPIHAFFISLDSNEELLGREQQAAADFVAMNVPLESAAVSPAAADYNVIVVMLESVRASTIGVYHGGQSLTPNLDAFAKHHIHARNFYANTNFTVKAETAIWCGLMDHNAKPPLSKYSERLSLNCLPELLSNKRGYSTRFYHGYKSDFYSRDRFLPKVGFQYRYFHSDQVPDESRRIGWGVSDEAMYSLMLNDLYTVATPFFAHITTLSSHYPFKWDWPATVPLPVNSGQTLFENYQRAVQYEDYAFGRFWDKFKRSPLAKNTIVVVTADHGVWTFADNEDMSNQVLLDEQFFRMPLMIYHPDISEHIEVGQVSSQLDIAPTLAAMLGLDDEGTFIGKNILEAAAKPWALMMKSGQLVVRVEDRLCRIKDRSCAGLHQECVAHQFGELFLEKFTDMQQCYDLNGDLLRGGRYSNAQTDEPWLQRGFDLVNFHNKQALGAEPENILARQPH
ncbi:MAG: hypothetical protein CMN82_06445 [Spongiibacter sp.]|nr:hypothetical protein [Spongiibacter sp.]MBI59113.1 hypothetical protein [Spongiibacter sp.]|tara:strand:- start:711 stop:2504 length:1794 start_codon:yes stop_codon:yes gene_type:complete